MRAVLVAMWVGGVALGSPPAFVWEGRLAWQLPAGTLSLSAEAELGWALGPWAWKILTSFADGRWNSLELAGAGKLGALELFPSLAFDPEEVAFRALTVPWKLPEGQLRIEGLGRLEGRGFGWGLTILGPRDAFLERVRLRFNLKRFSDEVLEDTFVPSFSFGEVRVRAPLSCCGLRLWGWLQFTKKGFSELGLSLPLPLPRESGLLASAVIRFTTDKKAVSLAPGFTYTLPACVEAFLGLDWDPSTWTIQGIRVYAVGWYCQVGEVRVRALTMFEPIGLVKEPYWEAVWLTWEGGGCCGPTHFHFAAFFRDSGLFGLGAVEMETKVAVTPNVQLGFAIAVPLEGPVSLTLGWKAKL